MKHISASVYKTNSIFIWLFIAVMMLCSILSLIGLILLLFKVEFIHSLNSRNYIIFLIQAVLGLIVAWKSFKSRKYSIKLNQDEIDFYIPKAKKPVNIKLIEIQSLMVLDDKIELFLKDNKTETINLNYFYLPLKEDIKQYFIELRNRMNS